MLPHFVVVGAGHALHVPPVHVAPVAQAVPHAPQFAGSVIVSTHAVPHTVFVHALVSAGGASPPIAVSATSAPIDVSSGGAPVSSAGGAVSSPVVVSRPPLSAASVSSATALSLTSSGMLSSDPPHPTASARLKTAQTAAFRKLFMPRPPLDDVVRDAPRNRRSTTSGQPSGCRRTETSHPHRTHSPTRRSQRGSSAGH